MRSRRSGKVYRKIPFVKIVKGELKLSRMEGARIEVDAAKGLLETILPKIRIEDVLLEVHRRSGFLSELKPLAGYDARPSVKHEKTLLAALIAHGTNLGIAAMGNSTKGISIDELSHTSRWFIRDSTIKAANSVIVLSEGHQNTWIEGFKPWKSRLVKLSNYNSTLK